MQGNEVEKTPAQRAGIRNTLVWLLGFIALLLGLFLFNFLGERGLSTADLKKLGYFGFVEVRELADFQLLNHRGEAVGLEHLRGTWSLIFFGFTLCPDFCPTTLGVLNRVMDNVKKKPQVVMVSVDPERDTPERLGQYILSFNDGFVGYTGEFDQVASLATQLNIAFGKVPGSQPGTYTVDHSVSIVVVNPDGKYAGFIKAPHQAVNITQIIDSLML